MTTAVLLVTDGRLDYLRRTVASLMSQTVGDLSEWYMFDDSGDAAHRAALAAEFPLWRHINDGPRRGFGGAISAAWSMLAAESSADHIAHVEADFTFNRMVDVDELAAVLDANPHLAQLALRRQPWNAHEHAAGGVVEQYPDSYTEVSDDAGRHWLEHRRFFSTNPCLYRRSLCFVGWLAGAESEGRFGQQLLAHGTPEEPDGSKVRFAFWGRRHDEPWVEHIGAVRIGTGY
jgi:hypothetical protein